MVFGTRTPNTDASICLYCKQPYRRRHHSNERNRATGHLSRANEAYTEDTLSAQVQICANCESMANSDCNAREKIKTSIQSEIATIQVFNYGHLNSKTKGGNNKVVGVE